MKKLPVVFFLFAFFSCFEAVAGITLTAITYPGKPAVTIQWNMVNYPGSTAYTLFKSTDGLVWEITAANPVFRNYTSSTILAYRDNFSNEQKLFYRVKVYDTNENIVDISNTAVVENPKNYSLVEKAPVHKKSVLMYDRATVSEPVTTGRNIWQVASNPVGDMLNLAYKGKDIIRGVINVVIQDASGKVVVHFRAASNNKLLHFSVSDLHAGLYFIKVNIAGEVQLNEKFIKD